MLRGLRAQDQLLDHGCGRRDGCDDRLGSHVRPFMNRRDHSLPYDQSNTGKARTQEFSYEQTQINRLHFHPNRGIMVHRTKVMPGPEPPRR
jgi:hypothetical protein